MTENKIEVGREIKKNKKNFIYLCIGLLFMIMKLLIYSINFLSQGLFLILIFKF